MASKALAYVGGGLLSGIGAGMVAAGAAKREQALEEIRFERQRTLAREGRAFQASEAEKGRDFTRSQSEADRDFRTSEREAGQTFQSGEAEKGRTHQASEADKTRTHQASEAEKGRAHQSGLLSNTERFSDAEGNIYVRKSDGTAMPLKGPEGNLLKASPKDRGTAPGSTPKDTAKAVSDAIDAATDTAGSTDWSKVVTILEQSGIPPTAAIRRKAGEQAADLDLNPATDQELTQAEQQLKSEGKLRSGWFVDNEDAILERVQRNRMGGAGASGGDGGTQNAATQPFKSGERRWVRVGEETFQVEWDSKISKWRKVEEGRQSEGRPR